VGDDGTLTDVPLRWLPACLSEGSVVRVAAPARGILDWARAALDEVARARRDAALRAILDELRWHEPGGGRGVGCLIPPRLLPTRPFVSVGCF
jgi:hypothetical protein